MIRTATLFAALVFAAPVAAQMASLPYASPQAGGASGGGAAGPALRRAVTVTGEIVRIGDLIENAGAVADVPIFRAPDLGQTGSLPATRVLEAVRKHHIIWLNTRGYDEVVVTRATRVVDGK